MKKFLSIILSILMVVTMLPMSVMPASAAENLDYNIKLEVVDWAVYETSGELIGEFNAVEHGDAFYDVSLTQADDGTFTCSYQIALERNDGNTAWGESSISFKIDSCEDEFMQEFEKSFYSRYNIFYNLKVTRSAGDSHTFKDATCVAPKTCAICGVTEGDIDATAHSWANLDGICANGCGLECTHENQTGSVCEICGEHICSYNNGFCTECDAYEPATDYNADGVYEIYNAGQLFWFAQQVNEEGNKEIKCTLRANIDLENRPWTPIGAMGEENSFRGVFDGLNYAIRGLYVEGSENGVGFFGEVRTGTVRNFTIYGEVVVNTEVDYVGGVIGSICGVNGETDLERNGAIIQNITSYVNVTAKAHGIGMIGGFVGHADHQSLIEQCSWYGTFDAGEYRVDSGAGGFIGKIQENTSEVTIRNCGAYGTIKTNYAGDYNNTATIYMGGFLSFSNTNAKTTLENCLFAGRFERGENLTDEARLGAFGTLRSVNAIKNCYYLGDDGLAAVHSDSNLKPGSDNVAITSVTGEELRSNTIATRLGECWTQGEHYPVPHNDVWEHSHSYTYADNGNGTHDKVCDICRYVEVDNEAHSGGTASCTEQAKCERCGASYGEVNHDFGSGNTCICGAEIAFTGIVVDDENSDEYRYDETRKTYTIIIPADEVGGNGYLSYDIIGTNLTLIEDTNTLLKVQHENEDGLTPAPDDLLVDVLQDNGYFGWSVLGYGDGEWEKLLYSNDGGMTWTTYTFEVKQAYSITVNASQNGTVTANEYAIEGDNIALNVSPAEGYMLDTLSVTDASGNSVDVENNAFTMPASAVTVTATFAVCDHKDGRHETATDNGDGTHDATYSCCGTTVTEGHSGGTATCTEQAKCQHCGASYGELDPDNHASDTYIYTDNGDGTHTKTHECGVVVVESEAHTIENHVCTGCGAMEIVVSFNAGDYEWKTGDQINFVREVEGIGIDDCVFTATVAEDGTVTWTADKPFCWYGEGEQKLFAAPNNGWSVDYFVIPEDQSTSAKLDEADLVNGMWVGTPTTDTVTFNVTHRMAKVTVNYEFAEGVTADISELKVYSIAQICSFSTDDWSIKLTSAGQYDVWVTPYLGGNQFTAFIIPETYATDEDFIKITLSDGTVYEVKMNKAVTFAEGAEYTYKVVITADGAYLTCADECSFEYIANEDGLTHSKVCSVCGYVAASEAHSGGTATCTEQAECQHCGASYGEVNAHDWSNLDGVCANGCGAECPHDSYTDGVCDNCNYECPHEWGEGVLTRPVYDAVLGSKDGYYTYTCTVCDEEKTETVKSADYSAYEAVSEEINALLQSEELTDAAKQAIYSAANECGHLSNDLTESEQNIVDDLVAELEKIVADAEEKIASGEYVKADYTEIDEAIASVDEALENATINEEMANELSDIKSQLEALKENENTSMADAAELLERVKAVAETMADCANGIHSFTKYEVTEEAECGKTGKEVASCDHGCGATDENEIPALTHKDEDGDYLCDHGCGHEFEQPVEPEQPDTPDEPEQPEEDGTICEYCSGNHNNPITRIFCRITQFFIRLFTFLGFWE